MGKFAENTTVDVAKSQAEIASLVTKYGANGFLYGQDEDAGIAMVRFRAKGRIVRFDVPLSVDRSEFVYTAGNVRRSADAIQAKVDQEIRRRWRALVLAIKAKLEVVETGISTFEQEFLAHIELPDGTTVGDWAAPQLEHAYATGNHLPMLPGTGNQQLELTSG
jgi:hypothetical protein